MEEREGTVGRGTEVGIAGGIDEVPEAVERDGEVTGVGAVVFPEPALVGLQGEGALLLSGEGAVGNEVGADLADPRERGEASDLLVSCLRLEARRELSGRLAEAAVDITRRADAGGDHLGYGEGGEGEGRVALLPGVVLLEGAVAGGAAVPEAAGAGGDGAGEVLRKGGVGQGLLREEDRVAALLEDDRGEVTHPVVPEVPVEAAEGRAVRVATALGEDARQELGEKLAEGGGHRK